MLDNISRIARNSLTTSFLCLQRMENQGKNFSFIIIQQSLQSHSAQQQVLLHQLRNRLQEYE